MKNDRNKTKDELIAELEDLRRRISERRDAGTERDAALKLMGLMGSPDSRRDLIKALVRYLFEWSGCEAVGIRLKEGDDFPYYETRGFPEQFVEMERSLCARDLKGQLLRDDVGNPVIECMCGNVICGRFDPSKPFFTRHGSFWSNCTTDLLAATTEADRQARTRNRCNGEGYESVALVPLRAGAETFGLIQLNDRRKDRFTGEFIEAVERMADGIAVTLAHRMAQEALQASLDKFHTVADYTYDWEYWMGPDGALLYISPACQTITGYGREEFLANPSLLKTIIHPDDREAISRHIDAELMTHRFHELDFRIIKKNGDTRWISHRCRPVYGPGGEHRGSRTSNRDITGRMEMTSRLQEREETLRALLDAITESAFLLDLDGKALAMNETLARRMGATVPELLGKNLYDMLPPNLVEKRKEYVRQVIRTGKPVTFRDERNGLIQETTIQPVFDHKGGVAQLALFVHDVTERIHAGEKLQRHAEMTEAIKELQSLYIENMDDTVIFNRALDILVKASGSEFGFLDEVLHDKKGEPYKLSLAMSNISWDDDSRRLYGELAARKLEFRDLGNLAGLPAVTGEVVIVNDREHDPRARDLPPGHPPITSYMGIPLYAGGKLLGVAGLANRQGGYARETADFLGPLISATANILMAVRSRDRERNYRETISESEERFRQLAENINIVFYVQDRATARFIYVSPAYEKVWGRPLHEIMEDPYSFLHPVHPEDREGLDEAIRRELEEGVFVNHEYRIIRPDGGVRWVHSRNFPVYNDKLEVYRVTGLAEDITDRKLMEVALRESEEHVRKKMEALLSPEGDMGTLDLGDVLDQKEIQSLMDDFYALTRIGVGIIDMNGRVLVGTGWQDICTRFHRVHPETCRNCRESDLLLSEGVEPGTFRLYRCKNNMWDIATPIMVGKRRLGNLFLGQFLFEGEEPDTELFRSQARRYGFNEEEYIAALQRVPRFSRETIDTVMTFYMKLSRILSTMSMINISLARSLSDQERLNAALRENEELLATMFNNISTLIGISTIEGGVLREVNDTFLATLGLDRNEVIGISSKQLGIWTDPAERDRIVAEFQEGSAVSRREVRLRRRDGTVITTLFSMYPIMYRGEQHLLSEAVDITERKRAEELLEVQRDLGIALSGASDLAAALASVMEAVLRIEGIDAGGIYLSEVDGSLRLVVHHGLSLSIYEQNRELKADTMQAMIVMRGKPVYIDHSMPLDPAVREIYEREFQPQGIKAIAIVPILFQGRVIGCLNIASHSFNLIHQHNRDALETIASRIGSVISRLQAESQRAAVQEALQKSEEQYRELVENASSIIIKLDPRGNITFFNEFAQKFFGYGGDEILGRNVIGTIIPASDSTGNDLADMMDDILAAPEKYAINENENMKKDGTRAWIRWTNRPVYDNDGALTGILAVGTDITERQRAEIALTESRECLHAAVEASLDSFMLFKAEYNENGDIGDFIFTELNRRAEQMLQINRQDLIGKRMCEVLPINRTAGYFEKYKKVMETGIPLEEEFHLPVTHVPASWHYHQVVSTGDGIAISHRDISTRKKAEERLRESEERYRLIYEQSSTGIAQVLPDGRFIGANRRLCEIVGYSLEELKSMTFSDITHPDDLQLDMNLIKQVVDGSIDSYVLEKRYIHKNGQTVWIKMNSSVVRDEKGDILYTIPIIDDITATREYQGRIQAALAEKETLLRELYHRTKNNMQVICAMLDLQAEQIGDERIVASFSDMGNRIRSMALVHQKLYQSKSLSRINLGEYLHDLATVLFDNCNLSHEAVSLDFDCDDVPVDIDIAIPLGLVVNELITNAFKHAFPGERRGRVAVRLNREAGGENILLEITDDGAGVPAGFDFRACESLGLQTVFTLVEQQIKGSIRTEASAGVRHFIRFRQDLGSERV